MLNLLAFLFHTVLDLCDEQYRRVRAELATRQTFFNDLQALIRYLYLDNWQVLINFMFPPPHAAEATPISESRRKRLPPRLARTRNPLFSRSARYIWSSWAFPTHLSNSAVRSTIKHVEAAAHWQIYLPDERLSR